MHTELAQVKNTFPVVTRTVTIMALSANIHVQYVNIWGMCIHAFSFDKQIIHLGGKPDLRGKQSPR